MTDRQTDDRQTDDRQTDGRQQIVNKTQRKDNKSTGAAIKL